MLLQLKNKNLQAIERAISDAKAVGGIPKHVILTPVEAAELLREHVALNQDDIKSILQFTFVDEEAAKLKFALRKELTLEQVKEFVKRWYLGQVTITFNEVPLIVQANKKAKKKAEKVVKAVEGKGKEWHH